METEQATISQGPTTELVLAKTAAMASLGLASLGIGLLPLQLASCLRWGPSRQPLAVSLLLCFGGGVLLATAMLHLQPEVAAQASRLPLGLGADPAQLLLCAGFFLVYFVEELVHLCLDSRPSDDEVALQRTMSVRKSTPAIPRISLSKTAPGPTNPQMPFTKTESLDPRGRFAPPESDTASSSSTPTVSRSFRGLFTVLALSFHSVFEGLAVGLQDSVAEVAYLSAAIATHKLVIAFCVGVELVVSRTKRLLVFLYVATFAIVTPAGIGLGLGLSFGHKGAGSETVAMTSVILQGLATGTLLYVVFFEVLQTEKNKDHSGMIQLMAILAGFIVMFTLHIFMGHNHDHGGDDHFHHYELASTTPAHLHDDHDHNHDHDHDHHHHH